MGLRDLFNKESKCEKCNIILPKKQLSEYDTTHQGQYKNGETSKVCNKCLMELFYRDLRSFNELAVVIYPIKGFNSYVSYSFDKLLNTKQSNNRIEEETKEFVNDLKELLPANNINCSCCENIATFTWCSSELFNNDPFTWKVNKDIGFENSYLCKECLISAFQKKIEEENISFKYIYPPIEGKGFLCSWEI